MSVENLKEYGKRCAENEEVRKKAKEIGLKDIDGHIAHGKSLGLEFSEEDFAALAKEIGLDGKNELNEEELKKIAGGFAMATIGVACGVAAVVGTVGFLVGFNAGW
jgi:predicted ribosomally synthesized peptide with nif11-like leader